MILFLILSLPAFPSIFLKNSISQACIALCLNSQECVTIDLYIVLYTTTFVLLDISTLYSRVVLILWKHFPADAILSDFFYRHKYSTQLSLSSPAQGTAFTVGHLIVPRSQSHVTSLQQIMSAINANLQTRSFFRSTQNTKTLCGKNV
jgi:hypothetical protein